MSRGQNSEDEWVEWDEGREQKEVLPCNRKQEPSFIEREHGTMNNIFVEIGKIYAKKSF